MTAFSLMSYDFNSAQPGPNAPLWSLSICTSLSLFPILSLICLRWVTHLLLSMIPPDKRDIVSSKMLVGLNFYGRDFGPGTADAIIGSQYVSLLEEHKPKIVWDLEAKVDYFVSSIHSAICDCA